MKKDSKDLIIENLRAENLDLKLKLLQAKTPLPSGDVNRKTYFNDFHNKKKDFENVGNSKSVG
jgi:hypothetical protein